MPREAGTATLPHSCHLAAMVCALNAHAMPSPDHPTNRVLDRREDMTLLRRARVLRRENIRTQKASLPWQHEEVGHSHCVGVGTGEAKDRVLLRASTAWHVAYTLPQNPVTTYV